MNDGKEELDRGPKRHGPLLAGVTVALAGAFIAIGCWASYQAPLRNDQYELIQLGQCVRGGGRLYVDCWENKPPGVAWINALGLAAAGGDPLGPWVLPGIAAAAALALVWAAATRLFSVRTGRRTVLIAALVYAIRIYDTPSINPDFYASVFELAASALWFLALAGKGETARQARASTFCALGGGLLWSAAATCKQVGCVGLIAVTLVTLAIAAARHEESRRWLRTVAPAWVGFVIGIGAVAGVLGYQYTIGEAWGAIVTYNVRFADGGALIEALGGGRVRGALAPVAAFVWLAVIGGGVTLCAGSAGTVARSWFAAVVLWWVAAVAFALLGPSGSMRYWQATFPPMFWLAGAGVYHIQQVQERLERTQRLTFIAVTITALLLLMRPTLDEVRIGLAASYAESTEHPGERDRLADTGRRLRELVPQGERIYVWGYRAGVYVYSDRPAASRFTYPRSPAQMNEILDDLEAGKAYIVLVPRRRASEFEQFCDDACHRRLDRVLEGCVAVAPIGPYNAWMRGADKR